MDQRHAHDCEYQVVVTTMARAIAEEIARVLPHAVLPGGIDAAAAPSNLPATLSVDQAAEVMGIGRGSVYEGVRTEEIPSLRIGTRIKIPTGRLYEYLATGRPWRETKAALRASLAE